MAETKVPNGKPFSIVLALSYSIDPLATIVPINEYRAVVLSGEGDPVTNKSKSRYPEAGDTDDIFLGICNSGGREALAGDFPDPSETHISVVEAGRYIIEVAPTETIAVGAASYGVDAEGRITAAGNGIFDTAKIKPVDASSTSTVASPSFIRVSIEK